MNRRDTGARGERMAVDFLKRKGYHIRETNYRCREGEIDIVAENGPFLVFVEVRTKTDASFGTPEESITAAKKQKLISLAQAYRDSHTGLPSDWRIDVVAIELHEKGHKSRLHLIKNITG
ncbi:MAG: YraN family protein [Chloroflexota bacterium]